MSPGAREGADGAGLHRAGLCAGCRYARVIHNRRGSWFLLCQRSGEDPTFPRYPRLPVLDCEGYEPAGAGSPVRDDEV